MPPPKSNLTLLDCLQHFSQEEILDGDTKWYSERDNCHKVAKKSNVLEHTNPINHSSEEIFKPTT